MDIETYGALKSYVNNTMAGAGAVAGKPCQIQSITPIIGGNTVTFLWEDNNGVQHTSEMDVMDGVIGPQGPQGERGLTGAQGPQGERGNTGAQGIQGPRGEKGETGAQGAQGSKGDTGAQGPKGDKGDTGAQGPQGLQGIQGIKGDKGDDGYPFLIYKQYNDISEFTPYDFPQIGLMFMVMTWVENHGYPVYRYTGDTTPPYSLVVYLNTEGIKGEKGDKGDKGDQGIQGEKGVKGDKGDTGEQGIQGIQGETGPQGIQGAQGIQGIQGEDGTGITSIVFKEMNSNGDYVYTVNLTDSTHYDITCPRGPYGQPVDRTFNVLVADWIANSGATSTDYPYIAQIPTDVYNDYSKPIWQMGGAGAIPTSDERADINLVLEATFSSTGITLYATDTPSIALVLEVKGE